MNPTEYANAALDKIIRHCHETRGAAAELTRRLGSRVGQEVEPRSVRRWLDMDKQARVEPALGIGLLLIEVGQQMLDESCPEIKAGSTYVLRRSKDSLWVAHWKTDGQYSVTALLKEAKRFKGSTLTAAGARGGRVLEFDVVELPT